MRILFVCMGNICRSPMVETIARIEFSRVNRDVEVASVGTENYHVGEPADRRAIRIAESAGYPLSAHQARQLARTDFDAFDHLLAMDAVNLGAMHKLCPPSAAQKVALFLPFSGIAERLDVPDPYYGSDADFEYVLQLSQLAIRSLISRQDESVQLH